MRKKLLENLIRHKPNAIQPIDSLYVFLGPRIIDSLKRQGFESVGQLAKKRKDIMPDFDYLKETWAKLIRFVPIRNVTIDSLLPFLGQITITSLKKHGIQNIAQLRQASRDELKTIPRIGYAGTTRIEKVLSAFDLRPISR